jgi:hypothetical protein
MLCTVDALDREDLSCIIGQNEDGTAPLQLQVPRLRHLLSLSEAFIALVDDPAKVPHIFHLLCPACRHCLPVPH